MGRGDPPRRARGEAPVQLRRHEARNEEFQTRSPSPPRAPCPPPRATIASPAAEVKRLRTGEARGGAPKRSSFDNPALFEESRTRPAPECQREADQGVRPLRGRGGRRPRRRHLSGYSDARGGERDGSAEGDALTSPSRSSRARRRAPPVCTPTSRRRPPQRGHSKTSRAKTRRSSRVERRPATRHPKLVAHEPATAAIQDRRTPHPSCPILHPAVGRKAS